MVGNAPHLVELVEHLLRERHVVADEWPAHAAVPLLVLVLVGGGAATPVRQLEGVSDICR